MEKISVLKCLWNVKEAVNKGDVELKDRIIELYRKLTYSTLKVSIGDVSDLTVNDLKNKIKENLSDNDLIDFLKIRMEYDNPKVYLNYIVHCVKTIDYRKNRPDCIIEYHQRILSYFCCLYYFIVGPSDNSDEVDFNPKLDVLSEVSSAVIDKVSELLLTDEEISSDELYEFISAQFKEKNPVKSIGSI